MINQLQAGRADRTVERKQDGDLKVLPALLCQEYYFTLEVVFMYFSVFRRLKVSVKQSHAVHGTICEPQLNRINRIKCVRSVTTLPEGRVTTRCATMVTSAHPQNLESVFLFNVASVGVEEER